MKTFQSLLPAFGLVAAVMGWSNDTTTWETVTVSSYTTVCPAATTFTQNHKTYTATASETLTITDCPCTLTKPVTSTPAIIIPPSHNATVVPPVWVTTTVSEYTTWCPGPTSVVQGNQTYTITSATTLTITNCPCTVSYPPTTTKTVTVSTLTTYCPAPTTITYSSVTYPVTTSGTVTIPIVSVTTIPNSPPTPTAPGVTAAPAPTGASPPVPTSSILQANEAAGKNTGFFGLAIAGFAAMLI